MAGKKNPLGDNAQALDTHLRHSVGSARSLTFALSGMNGPLGSSVQATAAIAENIAKASRNAKIAASATGIGAVVAVLATVAALTIGWKEETEMIAQKVRDVRNETAQLAAQANGDKRLERELAITAAMEGELDAAKKMEHFYRKFPELQAAIRQKADAARRAADEEANRAYGSQRFDLSRPGLGSGGTDKQRALAAGMRDLQFQREQRLRDLARNTEGFNKDQVEVLKGDIQAQFDKDLTELQYELEADARKIGESIGRSIAGSISDGISEAIKNRSFIDGFRALTGSILIGFGEMMQEIGTQALLAAQLMSKIVDALSSFAPDGAIGPALVLIALGGVLKGVGASMQGHGGGGGGGSTGSRTLLTGGMVVASASAGGAGSLSAIAPNRYQFTIIGEDDARAQRTVLSLMDKAEARRGRR